ncbi:MAG: hypothetical protein V1873_03745 [Verrucomicrobiota bacterium]
MKELVTMWTSPRLVLGFFVTAAFQVAVRVPFAWFQMIPYYLDFHPGVVFVPLAGVFFGPAGAWGSLAASLLGDRLMGPWGWISVFRGLGFFLFALSTQKIWDAALSRHAEPAEPAPTWNHTLRFIFASWPGCLLGAAWQGLGAELLGAYPFAYVMILLAMNNLLFCTMLGLPLYRLAARYWVPRFGGWHESLGAGAPTTPMSVALIVAGAAGACLLGWFVSWFRYGVELFEPFVLGTRTGILVPLCVVPLLLAHAAGVFRNG